MNEKPVPGRALRKMMAVKSALTKSLDALVIVVMALLVVDVLWGVFSRYVLGHQTRWTEELARVLLIWVGLLGSAVAFGTKAHLGLDVVVKQLDSGAQKLVAIVMQGLVFLFAASVMVAGGWGLVQRTFEMQQTMPALGIAKGYVYLAVPISGVFIILYALEAIAELLSGADPKTGGMSLD